jgi:hypothetical protein
MIRASKNFSLRRRLSDPVPVVLRREKVQASPGGAGGFGVGSGVGSGVGVGFGGPGGGGLYRVIREMLTHSVPCCQGLL